MSRPRIFHFGAFDHDNYGDLLFPLILEKQLEDLDAEIVHVAPAGAPTPWSDARPCIGFAEAFSDSRPVSGVVVGGGDIILEGNWCPPANIQLPVRTVLPGLWLGAAALAERHGAPLAWNAPGVAETMPEWARPHLRRAAGRAAPLAVRDATSAAHLQKMTGLAPAVTPDTAFGLPDVWSMEELADVAGRYLASRGCDPAAPTLAIFIGAGRHGDAELPGLIGTVARATGLTPVLIEICPWQARPGFLQDIAGRVGEGAIAVDRPAELRLVAALIATSMLYIGESLHGLITAVSYGKPALVVPPAGASNHKYAASAAIAAPLSRWATTWKDAARMLTGWQPSACPPSSRARLDIQTRLATHNRALLDALRAARQTPGDAPPLIPIPLARYWADAEASRTSAVAVQLFWANDDEAFSEARSIRLTTTAGAATTLRLPLPAAARYRLDPAGTPGIGECKLTAVGQDQDHGPERTPIQEKNIRIGGSALPIAGAPGLLWAYADDPQVHFVHNPPPSASPAMELEIELRWFPLVAGPNGNAQTEAALKHYADVQRHAHIELERLKTETAALAHKINEQQSELNKSQDRVIELTALLSSGADKINRMQNSFSWRVTAPFRFIRRTLFDR